MLSSTRTYRLVVTWANDLRLLATYAALGSGRSERRSRGKGLNDLSKWENIGDILGTRERCLGMVPRLLTDARETSYGIFSSLLTAGCSGFPHSKR